MLTIFSLVLREEILLINRFEQDRLKIQRDMELQLNALDANRDNMSDTEYWNEIKSIHKQFSDRLSEVDEAQRFHDAELRQREREDASEPIEYDYAKVVGQLKRQKMEYLINKLVSCSGNGLLVDVDPNDPFYLDKKDPISVFERWWNEALSQYPSADELKDFLSKIDINDEGFITFNDRNKSNERIYPVSYDSRPLIKPEVMRSAAETRKLRKQQEMEKLRKRSPLLARKDPKGYLAKQKRLKAAAQKVNRANHLIDIMRAYGLPLDLEALLEEHLLCVYALKSSGREEDYINMLQMFLRNTVDHQQRLNAVKLCIQRCWRDLNNGIPR